MKIKSIKIIVVLVIILIIIDQASKILITRYIENPVGNEFIKIEIITNTGLAFGFNQGNVKNIFLTICVLAMIINFIRLQNDRMDNKTSVALGVILAGGVSNLIDRIFKGGVIDFIKIYKFPVFNVADVFVVIGWILLIIFLVIYSKKIEVEG